MDDKGKLLDTEQHYAWKDVLLHQDYIRKSASKLPPSILPKIIEEPKINHITVKIYSCLCDIN